MSYNQQTSQQQKDQPEVRAQGNKERGAPNANAQNTGPQKNAQGRDRDNEENEKARTKPYGKSDGQH